MTDDDPPEPGSVSDRLLDQADAAHERAVRKLQDDPRLADRFQELEHGSRDVLFYRLQRSPTLKDATEQKEAARDKATQPGLGPTRTQPVLVAVPQAAADAAEPAMPPPVVVPARGATARMPKATPIELPVEPHTASTEARPGSSRRLVGWALLALAVVVLLALMLARETPPSIVASASSVSATPSVNPPQPAAATAAAPATNATPHAPPESSAPLPSTGPSESAAPPPTAVETARPAKPAPAKTSEEDLSPLGQKKVRY